MRATDTLLAFAAAPHRLPDAAAADTRRLLADTLAVGAAGATAPFAAEVLAAAQRWGAGTEARLLGDGLRLPAPSAAFVNGFRIHCLEWDAVHEPAVVHALSVVTATLLAVADRAGGADPDAFLAAVAVGVEVAAGLGLAATGPLRFFRPATAGLLGAALAAARLEGLEPGRFADVLGLAVAQCAGTMQAHVEGSIALPLQIAHSARAALSAVDLAHAGLSGPHDALEGPYGYFALIEEGVPARCTEGLGDSWRIRDVSTKPWPSGRASHALLAGLAAVRDRPVARVELHAPPLVSRLVGRPWRPDMSAAHARLCGRFLGALMLAEGTIDPRRFTPAAFEDPALQALGARLNILDDGNPDPNALSPQRLHVTFGDGSCETIVIAATPGSPAAPLAPGQLAAKLALARALAPGTCDPRLFDDPLAYATEGS